MKKVLLLILPVLFTMSFSSANALESTKACTMDYNPVCGIDGVTYGNACMADKVKISYKGECELGNPANKVIKACTREYMPVCGAVQVQCIKAPCYAVFETFSNKCVMSTNPLAKLAYKGECKEKISNPSQIRLYKNIRTHRRQYFV